MLTASSMQLLSMPTIQELVGKVSKLQGFRQADEWREWRLEALAALGESEKSHNDLPLTASDIHA